MGKAGLERLAAWQKGQWDEAFGGGRIGNVYEYSKHVIKTLSISDNIIYIGYHLVWGRAQQIESSCKQKGQRKVTQTFLCS